MLLTGILVQNSNVMLKVMLMESKYWLKGMLYTFTK